MSYTVREFKTGCNHHCRTKSWKSNDLCCKTNISSETISTECSSNSEVDQYNCWQVNWVTHILVTTADSHQFEVCWHDILMLSLIPLNTRCWLWPCMPDLLDWTYPSCISHGVDIHEHTRATYHVALIYMKEQGSVRFGISASPTTKYQLLQHTRSDEHKNSGYAICCTLY